MTNLPGPEGLQPLLLQHLLAGVMVHAPDTRILFANDEATHLIGLTPDQLLGKVALDPIWSFVREDGTLMLAEEYPVNQVLATGEPIRDLVLGWKHPVHGERVWVLVRAYPERSPQGALCQIVVTFIDITERRRAEALVIAQRDLARLLATVTDPQVAWPRCLALALQVTAMECGGIYLFDEGAQALALVCHQGLSAAFLQQIARYPSDATHAQLMLAGQAIYLSAEETQQHRLFHCEGLASVAIMPIRHQGQVLGCVNLGSRTRLQVPPWTRHALETIATEIGNIVVALRTASTLRELNTSLERSIAERTAALQVSQERLTLAARSAGLGIWDWDIQADVLSWDERMYELYGVAPEAFGSNYAAWRNGLYPDDQAEAEQAILRTLRGEQEFDTEFRVRHPDGSVRVLKANAILQRGQGGEPLHMIGVNFDITERKRVELALREGEERYRTLVEYMTQGVIVYQGGHVVFCNAAATDIIGCADSDMLGCSIAELATLLHAEDAAGLHIWLEAELLGVSTYSTPFHFSRVTDGQLCWLVSDATATSYYDRPAVLIMLSDVTALKLAEEQLRLSEARLHMLLAQTPAVIFTALAEPDYRTTFISDTIRAVLGHEPAHYLENPSFWRSRIHPEDLRVLGNARAALREGDALQIEYRCRHADGSYHWVENGLRLLPPSPGRPHELIGYMIDITERKQAEEILRQANLEMIRAARMKDEFLANMSHELRSPLNAILGFSESLHDGVYGGLGERQRAALGHIETSGQHLLALITDILDLSKVEAGQMSIALERVTLAEICQASLLFVRQLALKKSLQLTFVPSDPAIQLEADPKRLKQILVNLLSNAVKFTPEGGQVSLEVATDMVAGTVHFAVRDTGIGIAPEELTRLFQPFVQLDSSLSRQHEGTGLGLALVRRLAELHGGTVQAASELGKGSCFTLVLPLHTPTPGAEPRSMLVPTQPLRGALDLARSSGPAREPGAAGVRILLAEDNEATILTTSDYLCARGFAVSVARTGPEALIAAVTHQPDLILTDVQLPRLDGLTLMRRLRALPLLAATPIIALTALTMPRDRERCLAAGANAYLSKPVRLKELVSLIEQLLQG